MEDKLIDLLVSITNLDKEFITNSMKNETGNTIVLNQFREKNKVFTKEDFELRERNLKETSDATYLNELIEMAKNQKLPNLLYNSVANNIITVQNKKLANGFEIELDDYSNTDKVFQSVKEKLSTVDNEQLQKDFDAQVKTIKEFQIKFDNQSEIHKAEIKQNNINIAFASELNEFKNKIDYEKDEELNSRLIVAESIFNNHYKIDIVDTKKVVKDKEGNIMKNETTKEPYSIKEIFDNEISKFVPVKKERSNGRADGNHRENDAKISANELEKKLESGEIKAYSKEHVEAEAAIESQE